MGVVNVNRVDNFKVTEGTLKRFWCQMGERFREQKESEMEKGLDTLTKWKSGVIPTPWGKKDDGQDWIEWKGEECPIPWAKEGEYEVKLRDGFVSGEGTAKGWGWNDGYDDSSIVSYRLTDGWVPVVDGECPKLGGVGTWEYKQRDGKMHEVKGSDPAGVESYYWKHSFHASESDIVAVRRLPLVWSEGQQIATNVERFLDNLTFSILNQESHKETRHEQVIIEREVDWLEEILLTPVNITLERNFAKEMREAVEGWGALVEGVRVGEVVEVEREVFAALVRSI